MKLNEQQKNVIKKLVSQEVKFNETYLEVYDHMVTALENRNTIPDIFIAYTEVLQQDLGGKAGLLKMEKGVTKAVKQAIQKKYLINFLLCTKWPGIALIVILCGIAYLDINLFDTSFIAAMLFIVCFALPWCFLVVRNFIAGFKLNELKGSYFNVVMSDIGILPFRIYFLAKAVIMALNLSLGLKLEMGPYVEHIYFILLIIHAIVFYGMSFNELKINLKHATQQ